MPVVGEGSVHTLDELLRRREAEVAFRMAKLALRNTCEKKNPSPSLSPLRRGEEEEGLECTSSRGSFRRGWSTSRAAGCASA